MLSLDLALKHKFQFSHVNRLILSLTLTEIERKTARWPMSFFMTLGCRVSFRGGGINRGKAFINDFVSCFIPYRAQIYILVFI